MTSASILPMQVALLGNPNCGKTALFNLLTGSRQKVANFAGVTVEHKEGMLRCASGRTVRILDLPGAYSLHPLSADEAITREVVIGARPDVETPSLLVCVTDATNLKLNLRLVLEARQLGLPMIVALNMSDLAQRRGLHIDCAALERELGVPVVETVGVRHDGARDLIDRLESHWPAAPEVSTLREAPSMEELMQTHRQVARIMKVAVTEPAADTRIAEAIDRVALHPVWGLPILALLLLLMFQAVFSWAQWPMDAIKASMQSLGALAQATLPAGPLRSLLVDGVIAGAGSVLVFLPQILILFLFILALEDSGYLPRAAFLLDRAMGVAGLSGRSFIPLMSSFACAIPGVMATRSIGSWSDRIVTIMIAPLMTCSARLPVYALLIGAFVPQREVAGLFNLQGLVLFSLYVAGIVSAMAVAWTFKRLRGDTTQAPLLMELPDYRLPHLRGLARGLLDRATIFVRRVGGIILALSVVLWFISSYPGAPTGATGSAIQYSFAGMLGHALEPLFRPIGFNWQICVALIPGLAAREVAVGALGTVYSLSAAGPDVAEQLAPLLTANWPLPTALSLLAWYVFAPQCISTLAAVRRETNSWRYPLLMAAYLFALAYLASFITFRIALAWGAA